MTVHVLHAGDGYSYLTRQVASADVAREPGQSLSDYYMQHGNPPGVWHGSGLEALGVSGTVTEAQMRALFGEGLHPDAERIVVAAIASGKTEKEADALVKLGRRYPQFQPVEEELRPALSAAYATFRADHGRDPEVGVERDLIRYNVARDLLTARGGTPSDTDVARFLARQGAQQKHPVAGYDLVFTPAKSVSTLWGLADPGTRAQIAEAHRVAWTEALAWVEKEAALTRVGAGGVAQIETKGLITAAFDHLDSRAGDPNLHTHVAVSNKVLGVDGKWRSLDGRVLHSLAVAASERYNANIESELRARLGVQFQEEARRAGRQGVREIAGIDAGVRRAFSQRRAAIEDAYGELLAMYRSRHGLEAPRPVQHKLAQQATLDTRTAKKTPVGLGVRLGEWRQTAARVLGSEHAVDAMIAGALAAAPHRDAVEVDVNVLVEQALTGLAAKRATWGRFHIEAEALRVAREHAGAGESVTDLAGRIAEGVRSVSLALTPPEVNEAPKVMQRSDGASIYTVHGSEKYTSLPVLEAEDTLVKAARTGGGLVVDGATFERAVAEVAESTGRTLNTGQLELARRFAAGGHVVEAGIGPAGTGKTTAMAAFARAVDLAGGRVVALAPSAAAAAVLGAELAVAGETLHKLLHAHDTAAADPDAELPEVLRLDDWTVLLVDEAGMAGTPDLAAVVALARRHGAAVRLLGDPRQLSAVGAGGALRLIDEQVGAAHLDVVHRFGTHGEAEASLLLRDGQTTGLDFYIARGRTTGGSVEAMREQLYAAWAADLAAGKDTVMVAATTTDVSELGARARLDRVTVGDVEAGGVQLHDGTYAGRGDVVVTRRNDRRLKVGPTDFVRNGDRWFVAERSTTGELHVRNLATKARAVLPADYVAENVELGYAATIHRVQGMTVDTSHTLVTDTTTREQLYTAVTRGRDSNRVYVVVEEVLEVDAHAKPAPQRAVEETLARVVAREGAPLSATATLEREFDTAHSLARLVPQYEDACTRLIDPTSLKRIEQSVQAAVPQIAQDLLDDDAWPALAARLVLHEAAGADLPSLLLKAVGARILDDADSIAQVLHHRLGYPATHHDVDERRLPSWIAPPPAPTPGTRAAVDADGDSTRRTVDPTVVAWMGRQADLIANRLDQLVEQVRIQRPAWTSGLDLGVDSALRQVVAYRDRYAITSTHPLGDHHTARGAQKRASESAAAALTLLAAREPERSDALPVPNARARAEAPTAARLLERVQRMREGAARYDTAATPARVPLPGGDGTDEQPAAAPPGDAADVARAEAERRREKEHRRRDEQRRRDQQRGRGPGIGR
ncbi:MobF family relaxase [Cellulomonas sp. 179-A 4D5 NHS]|uniref:MobF family relaxase n=1 Tax=Cellulomonas sp. 179-A 4D5 NHS TaxID=3142378 RepID=UPI0039A14BC0